ncbi:MAG: glycerophosphodiester phosphodiesterase family protein [Rhodospirillaceae bacterium]
MPAVMLPPVIGHRCARAEAPENTLAGLRRAAALGARWVEVDVRLTADGVPVLLHDARLERTTSGRGALAETTLAALGRFDAGAGEAVPTLAAFLPAALGFGIGVNLELKGEADDPEALTQAALTTAQRLWPDTAPPPLISSFEPACLAAAARIAPGWPRGLLLERLDAGWRDTAARVGAAAIIADHALILSGATVAALAAGGRAVAVYTVNDPARGQLLLSWGVAAIISDHPDIFSGLASG